MSSSYHTRYWFQNSFHSFKHNLSLWNWINKIKTFLYCLFNDWFNATINNFKVLNCSWRPFSFDMLNFVDSSKMNRKKLRNSGTVVHEINDDFFSKRICQIVSECVICQEIFERTLKHQKIFCIQLKNYKRNNEESELPLNNWILLVKQKEIWLLQ